MTFEIEFVMIRLCPVPDGTGFLLKRYFKNLLSREVFERVALNLKLSKIKLGFPKKVVWLFIILFIFFSFLGYYPSLSIPPIKHSKVLAQVLEQKGEVVSTSFSKPLNLPHPGYLSTRFSAWHPGVDIATGLGMPVHPITDGEVTEVGRNFFGLGNYVEVLHQNGFKSKYAHMGKLYVKLGQIITSDNTLGEVGLTGRTSGPHTHLEITHDGSYINPQTVLPPIPDFPASRGEPKLDLAKK